MIDNLKDLKIRHLQAIYNTAKDDDYLYNVLAILNECTLEDILNMPISKVNAMLSKLDFLNEQPKAKCRRKFDIAGKKYIAATVKEEMTTAQFIDYQQAIGSYQKDLAGFLAIFLIPEGHKYNDGYSMQDTIADIGEFSVEEGLALCAFFLQRLKRQLNYSVAYLKVLTWKRIRKATREQKQAIREASLHGSV